MTVRKPCPTKRQILVFLLLFSVAGWLRADSLVFTNTAPEGASWFTAGNWMGGLPTSTQSVNIGSADAPVHAIVDDSGAEGYTLGLSGETSLTNMVTLTIEPEGDLYVRYYMYVGRRSPAHLIVNGGRLRAYSLQIGDALPLNAPWGPVDVVQYDGLVQTVTNEYGVYRNIYLNKNGNVFPEGYPRYTLFGGKVDTSNLYVGFEGYGAFVIEGGTNHNGLLNIGGNRNNTTGTSTGQGGHGVYKQSGGRTETWLCSIGCANAWGHYEMSGGELDVDYMYVGKDHGTGTFQVVGSDADIYCAKYSQNEHSTLSVCLTNSSSSIYVNDYAGPILDGTLAVNLLGDYRPKSFSVVTVMTYRAGCRGAFSNVTLSPEHELLDVRVNYNNTCVTLDQWSYLPEGTILTIR